MGIPLPEDHPTYTLPDEEGEGALYGAADDPYSKLDTSLVLPWFVFKAHRRVYHSTRGSRVIKKEEKSSLVRMHPLHTAHSKCIFE